MDDRVACPQCQFRPDPALWACPRCQEPRYRKEKEEVDEVGAWGPDVPAGAGIKTHRYVRDLWTDKRIPAAEFPWWEREHDRGTGGGAIREGWMPVSRARRRAQQRLPHETIPALNTIGEYRTEFRWQPVEGRAKAKYEVEWNSFWIWLGTYLEGRNKPKKQHS